MFSNFKNKLVKWKEGIALKFFYKRYIDNNSRVTDVMNLKIDHRIINLLDERGLPSDERWKSNGWYKYMLLRYGFAMHFSKGKDVLETCSGLGWGAYLLDGVARTVTCIDIEKEPMRLSKKLWEVDRTSYIECSVLKIPVDDNKYDVVTAMESIEHFKLQDIRAYLSEMHRVLKMGGVLIGSSAFPDTRKEANALCSQHGYHLYICTKHEFEEILREQGFKKIKIFQNRLFFIARK